MSEDQLKQSNEATEHLINAFEKYCTAHQLPEMKSINELKTLRQQLTTKNEQLAKAITALEGLAFPMNGEQKWCFCDLAIGNSMFKTHADACVLASTTLAELKGNTK